MVFGFFFLTSLIVIISRSIHVAASGIILFFFYGWVVFHCVCVCVSVCVCVCVCVCVYTHIHIYIPHLLYPFIRHLGLPILAIVNSAAMNLGCMYLFEL